jgi:hypothetical protein
MFVGQQFLQNVLGYSTLDAGLSILPAAFCMVLVAPRSAKIVEARGARFALLFRVRARRLRGHARALEGAHPQLEGRAGLRARRDRGRARGDACVPLAHGLGAGQAVGIASGTAGLQRDLGSAIMQSIFGALLTAGYAKAASAMIAASGTHVSNSVESQLTKSFAGAQAIAKQYPQYASQITAAAKTSFLQGDNRASPPGSSPSWSAR